MIEDEHEDEDGTARLHTVQGNKSREGSKSGFGKENFSYLIEDLTRSLGEEDSANRQTLPGGLENGIDWLSKAS